MYHKKQYKDMKNRTLVVFDCLMSIVQGKCEVSVARNICNLPIWGYKRLCEYILKSKNIEIQYHLELGEFLGIIANVAVDQNAPILSSIIMPVGQIIPSIGYYRAANKLDLYSDDGEFNISMQRKLSKGVLQKRIAFVKNQLEQLKTLSEKDFSKIRKNLEKELDRMITLKK